MVSAKNLLKMDDLSVNYPFNVHYNDFCRVLTILFQSKIFKIVHKHSFTLTLVVYNKLLYLPGRMVVNLGLGQSVSSAAV